MNKAIKKNYLNAKQAYDDHILHLQQLQAKGASLDAEMPALRKAAEEAEAEKKKAIDNFCIGKVVESEVERAQNAYDTAKAKLSHSEELHATVNKKIEVAESQTVKLSDQVRKYQAEVWDQIVPNIERRIIDKVGKDLVFLYAANMRQRGAWDYELLLTKKLFPRPMREQLDAFAGTLDSKFEKAIR